MATTASDKPSASAEEALKRQKKQARREAKLMLVIKEAKRDLKKAQKQQLKAQVSLEKRSTSLHTLEARLAELRASNSRAASDATSPDTTDAEPTPLLGEEATPPEDTVVIKDATGGEAMQENETAVERAPAPTTPRKTTAHKTAERTSTATKRPANRSQRTKKLSTDTGQEE